MIYLDYAATTPLDPAVAKCMMPFFSRNFANPSSVHSAGQAALRAVDNARYSIADLFGIKGTELIFCSGATEANNLALKGIVEASNPEKRLQVISSRIEHSSVLEPLHYLSNKKTDIEYISVDARGRLNPKDIIAALRDETILLTVSLANSETGIIQPLRQVGRLLRKYNEQRRADWLKASPRKRGSEPRRVLFHIDATQALNFLDCRPQLFNADAMSFSGHKIYGPKGIGLLYVRNGIKIQPQILGGHQERNLRSGTLNVPAIVGLAAALSTAVKDREKNGRRIGALRDRLAVGILQKFPSAVLNTDLNNSLPSHLNISFPGYDGDALLAALDSRGIAVSTGSACASGDITVSPVLRAMGRDEATARAALRFSLGKQTTLADIRRTLVVLQSIIDRHAFPRAH